MLIPAHVREHFDQVVAGLQKRNIDAAPQLTTLLSLDEKRRATQSTLDQTLAQANAIAKEIGQLFKQGASEEATAKKQVDKKYGPGTFDNLPQDSQMLLVDYQYNLGTLSGFPSFVKATVEGNKEQMLAQHKRFGAGKPLTKRNEWTANVINNLEIPKPYDPMKEVTVPLANVPDATSVVQPDFLQTIDIYPAVFLEND